MSTNFQEKEESKNKISTRITTEADTDFVRRTHHAAYRDVIERQFGSFDEKMQDDFFASIWKHGAYEILLKGDKEIGFCFIEHYSDHTFIRELVLLPEFQGQGIGSNVLRRAIEESKTNNIPIKLRVLIKNRAQHLYRKMGFKDIGVNDTHFEMKYNPADRD